MRGGTHRANYGYAKLTRGDANTCIRTLSDQGCIVQRVVLANDRPAIRVKADETTSQLGKPTTVLRDGRHFAQVEMCGCDVYWQVKVQ